ncbi:MAG: glycogen synthase [Candidatus Komeilibacteria bacterium]|nr:glycogen synthase [Candidatus Komeilibacteria bacterium]
MNGNVLKIAHISSEVAPYSKSGGLGVVLRSLPKALHRLGHEVIVITPYYEKIIDAEAFKLEKVLADVEIKIDNMNTIKVDYWRGYLMGGLPVYFVGNRKYFGRKKKIYGSTKENRRFFVLDLAAIKLMKILEWKPDVVHCHDWHAGLVPELLKKRYGRDPFFSQAASIYTVHNLMYQFGKTWWAVPRNKRDKGTTALPSFDSEEFENINFAKRGIIHCDIINAVSEMYAREIMTKDFGEDLHRVLKNRREKLYGIVNGIDYDVYNPDKDPGLARKYNHRKVHRKKDNKKWLQEFLDLPQNPDIPIIAMVTRIAEQKGFDLLKKIIDDLVKLDLQIAILGSGEKELINFLQKARKKYPDKIGLHAHFSNKYETSFYAGSDMFLMPSRFEPCGLGQLISLRYGSVPIVRATGGLFDTIENFDPEKNTGNGFVFEKYSAKELLIAIIRALENFRHQKSWRDLIVRGMKVSSSWEIPAQKYAVLYHKAIQEKRH